jgi:hypothetical protein
MRKKFVKKTKKPREMTTEEVVKEIFHPIVAKKLKENSKLTK